MGAVWACVSGRVAVRATELALQRAAWDVIEWMSRLRFCYFAVTVLVGSWAPFSRCTGLHRRTDDPFPGRRGLRISSRPDSETAVSLFPSLVGHEDLAHMEEAAGARLGLSQAA